MLQDAISTPMRSRLSQTVASAILCRNAYPRFKVACGGNLPGLRLVYPAKCAHGDSHDVGGHRFGAYKMTDTDG
jgi:hypothetical protein